MMLDNDTPLITLLRLELRDLFRSTQDRKKELNVLDMVVSKKGPRPTGGST
jgi:hypothetical protein